MEKRWRIGMCGGMDRDREYKKEGKRAEIKVEENKRRGRGDKGERETKGVEEDGGGREKGRRDRGIGRSGSRVTA